MVTLFGPSQALNQIWGLNPSLEVVFAWVLWAMANGLAVENILIGQSHPHHVVQRRETRYYPNSISAHLTQGHVNSR